MGLVGGGEAAVWSRRGDELFYLGRTGLMAAVVDPRGPGLMVASRTTLFPVMRYARTASRNYDVSPDGQRFVMVRGEPAQAVWRLNALDGVRE